MSLDRGEKLDEVMITKDDSRSTFEYEKHYIIYPEFDWWKSKRHFTEGGKPIEEGFEYNSGTNTDWLSVDDLRERINQMY